MTTVQKLLIQGVRSYSPDEKAVIEFLLPVTLIVGANGSGKTTIIESLKLATTGEMPPNAQKGKSFVHDPKMRGKEEIRARISLRYKTVQDQVITCTRIFSLKNDKKKQKFAQVDNAIRFTEESGEKRDVHSKCTQLDKFIPESMGVSKAVLENVIFCHQEDANWPLSEPKALKVKFDDIFAATRYTKALENMKGIKKDKMKEFKDMQVEVATLRERRAEARKLEEVIASDEAKKAQKVDQMNEFKSQLQQHESELKKLKDVAEEIRTVTERIKQLQFQRSVYVKSKKELEESDNFQPGTETEAELREIRQGLGDEAAGVATNESKLQAELTAKTEEEKILNATLNSLYSKDGELKKEKEVFQQKIAQRKDLIIRLASIYNFEGFESGGDADRFRESMMSHLSGLEVELATTKKNTVMQREELQRLQNDATRDLANAQSARQQKQHEIESLSNEIRSLESKLKQNIASEVDIDVLQKDQDEKEKKFKKIQKSVNIDELRSMLERARSEKREIEKQLAQLDGAKDALDKEKEALMSIQVKKKDYEARQSQLASILATLSPLLLQILGEIPTEENVFDTTQRHVSKIKDDFQRASAGVQQSQFSIKQREEKLEDLRNKIKKIQLTIDNKETLLISAPRDISATLAQTEDELKNQENLNSMTGAIRTMYERYKATAKETRHCPLCNHSLDSIQSFMESVDLRMQKIPRSAEEARATISKISAQLQNLKELQRISTEVANLRGEIETDRANLSSLESDLAAAKSELQVKLAARSSAKTSLEAAEDLLQKSRAFGDARKESMKLKSEVEAMERGTKSPGKNLQSILDDIRRKRETLTAVQQKELAASTQLESAQIDLARAQEAFLAAKNKFSSHAGELRVKKDVEAQLQSVRAKRQEESNKTQDLDALITAAKDRCQKAAEKQQNFTSSNAGKEEAIQKKLDSGNKNYYDFDQLHKAVGSSTSSKLTEEERSVSEKKKNLQAKLQSTKNEISAIQKTLGEFQNKRKDHDELVRKIDDNIRFYELKNEIKKVDKEILSVRAQMEEMHAEHESLPMKVEAAERLIRDTAGTYEHIRGQIKTIVDNMKRNQEALRDPTLVGVAERYKTAAIEAKTLEMACTDLDRYHLALENAMMEFHRQKMEEVNKIIGEYWQATYRGSDIDTIEIKAEQNEEGMRTYNYRVVMKKDGVELDMRGRCSAGQRVLASLVIRLALSETFCLHCGILALDEPTTNLDHENIQSFAIAIGRLIESRRGDRSNFQLMVISHDEEFVKTIANQCQIESFYRVSKNENGCSTIEKEPIRALL